MQPTTEKMKRIGTGALMAFAWTSVAIFFVWSVGAVDHLSFLPDSISTILAIAYLLAGLFLLIRLPLKTRWLPIASLAIAVIYLLLLLERPSNDRRWDAAQRELASVVMNGQEIKIENFRHAVYRSEYDFDAQFQELRFELGQLESVWFVVQKFSAVEGLAHTFLSFGIETEEETKFFSVSVEIRREQGEIYSPIRGLYRQYELMYVVADERDVIGVRTVMRPGDRVYLYRVNASDKQVQQLFLDIADRINQLSQHPEFYHTFLNNCTNAIVLHTYDLTPQQINWLDPRIVLPGYSDRVAHSHGLIGLPGESFDDLQRRCRIDPLARKAGLSEQFSLEIRERAVTVNKIGDEL